MNPDQINSNYKQERLLTFFRDQKYADCTFKVDEEEFKAHRLILACSSPVFEKMFFGDLASSEIILGDIKAEEFRQLLEFIYTDKINLVSIVNAWSMVYVAKKYFMDDLAEVCLNYISANLTMSTLVLSYEYADLYNIEQLKMRCIRDIIDGVTGVFNIDYHMKPATLRSILKEDLIITKIDLVCKIIEWAMKDCDFRGLTANPENIVQILREEDILRYINKEVLLYSVCEYCNDTLLMCHCVDEVIHKTCTYLSSEVNWEEEPPDTELFARMVPYFCKSRNVYKIARRVDLHSSEEFLSSVSVSTDMLISGLFVCTEMNRTTGTSDVYKGCVVISFCEQDSNKDMVKPTIMKSVFFYDSQVYIPLRYPVTLLRDKIYDIRISYKNFISEMLSSIVCSYMSNELVDRERGYSKIYFYEHNGTLIKGVAYYPV